MQQAEVDDGLKAVADADDQVAVFNEPGQPVADIVFHPDRLNHAGPVVVAPAETAAEDQDLIIIETDRTVNNGIDVNPVSDSPGQLQRVSGFNVTVQAVAR